MFHLCFFVLSKGGWKNSEKPEWFEGWYPRVINVCLRPGNAMAFLYNCVMYNLFLKLTHHQKCFKNKRKKTFLAYVQALKDEKKHDMKKKKTVIGPAVVVQIFYAQKVIPGIFILHM